MSAWRPDRFAGEVAVLATMHGKERAIAPLLRRGMGIEVQVPAGLDTDRFGTFSRDVARPGSPRETALAKIREGLARMPHARLGLASEGSYGPHPQLPFLPWGSELVLLVDRESGLELAGRHMGTATHFAHAQVGDTASALAFARRVGFPRQGVIVMGVVDGQPCPAASLIKEAVTMQALAQAVEAALARHGIASIETDMRAHRNPVRMRWIRRATVDLLRAWRHHCPACDRPGFVVVERLPGRPCGDCGAPTRLPRAERLVCQGCGCRQERASAPGPADPAHCDICNP